MKGSANKWMQHIPEGVQDSLPDECYNQRIIEGNLRRIFHLSGYDEIDTPLFEYLDLFGGETASLKQEQMYKFFEPGSRIMVIRPDMTMPIARIAATKMKNRPLPLRLSYIGSVYRYEGKRQTRQREIAQAGIELLGSKKPEADAEVIALAVESLLQLGLSDFQMDIGQVDFFKGLIEEAGLNEEQSESLRHLIDQKNSLALEMQLKELSIPADIKNNLLRIPMLFGDEEVIQSAMALAKSERCTRALQNIDQVFRLLEKYGLSKYIAIDLGMVQSLNYYTGMIFRGMIRDMGYPVCAGGRYDTLVSEFGVDLPATGFALETRQLLVALERQKGLKPTPPTEVLFVYNPMEEEEGYARIQKLRSEGIRVEVFLPDDSNKSDEDYAREKGIRRIIRLRDGQMKEVTF
ncbi:MAG: ATP phosphoribosyltransferase regulatory subunit [Caldicoprobacterales bacterium]|jgi:ATP phosphoribosyltransferase regulatory subunit|nr:ATP phosphoribosyltransferase regulatory subunit [Clostridiales bacterium]